MPAGSRATNIADNVLVPHGVGCFFELNTTGDFLDLGDLGDEVNLTPLVEFLEHFSNRKGPRAVAKRILTSRGLTLEIVLNEVNGDNLRYVLYGGLLATGSINAIETAIPSKTATDTYVLTETPAAVVSVRSEDGETLYVLSTDYSVAGDTITAESGGALIGDAEGTRIHVNYLMAHADTRVSEMLQLTTIEGAMQFQIRNQNGGLAQIIELDNVQLAPNGAITVPAESIQTLPLLVTAQELNGMFGRVHTLTI